MRSWSYKVHPATAEILMRYPIRELKIYATDLGVTVGKTKAETAKNLAESGKATICGALGN